MNPKLLSYIAGYVDGEGCFLASAQSPRISVTNTFPNVLLLIQHHFGGSVRKMRSKYPYKTAWRYEVSGSKAIKLATSLIPHLREKQSQAKVLLRWTRNRKNKRLLAILSGLKRVDYSYLPDHYNEHKKRHKQYERDFQPNY